MPFDPVLWCLVYLAIGSLIWLFVFCAGGLADLPGWVVVAGSAALIFGWALMGFACAMGWLRLRKVYRAEAQRMVVAREARP